MTFAAAGTFFVVDSCDVVLDGNSIVGTVLFALFTADAGVFAGFLGCRTLIVGAAHYGNYSVTGMEGDYILGTSLNAHSAADAVLGVDVSNTAFDADGIGGAGREAVAAANASVNAGVMAAVNLGYRLAGGNTVVYGFSRGSGAGAVTLYKSHLRLFGFNFNAEKLRKLFRHGNRPGDTEIRCRFTESHGFRVAVTAGIAAGTAVSAGQTFTNLCGFLLLLNSEEMRSQNKQNGTDKSDAAYYD